MVFSSSHWSQDAFFYHIYPLGLCDAPEKNDFISPPINRLQKVSEWLPHMRSLGVNALYLGPVFESSKHGYDTANYYQVDRRLGDAASLSNLSETLHQQDIRLVLDAVLNHVGRDFWAFQDVQKNLQASPFCNWFAGLRFDAHNPYGEPFTYDTWHGHYDLVRLNVDNPEVRTHLFDAVKMWITEFNLDGLRLDAADCLSFSFLQELHSLCRQLKPDFWLMGEVVHGDYRQWVNPDTLDSVTNYEAYKGLYSSLTEKNYFEIAYTLNRQFGTEGIYQNLPLYNFVDNHDVDRVASKLNNPGYLHMVYLLLFSMPGVPSLYYGSEWGLKAQRAPDSDAPLRPNLNIAEMWQSAPEPDLPAFITMLSKLRADHPALQRGTYQQLFVSHQQLAFLRCSATEKLVVILNAAQEPVHLEIPLPFNSNQAQDILNRDTIVYIDNNHICLENFPSYRGCIMQIN